MGKSLALSVRNVYETLAICWPTVVDAALGRVTRASCDERLASWSRSVVANLGLQLDVVGAENLDPTRTHIIMSNHQSHYDVPVLFSLLGGNMRMVAKKELFDVPLLGRAMRESGFVEVDRSNRERAVESLRRAREHLASGVNIWIAPEGTRSRSGALLPFKKGGFHMAFETGLPILPIAIDGTRHVLEVSHARSSPGLRVRVTIGKVIEMGDFVDQGRRGREEVMRHVRDAITGGLA